MCGFEDFLLSNTKKFDLVFLDPPYSLRFEEKVFPKLISHLSDDAVVVLESEEPLKCFEDYEVIKNVKYGRVYITLYKPQLGGDTL